MFVLNYQHFHRQQLCASMRADINWNFGSSFLWAFEWVRYFQILFPWVFIIRIYKDIYILYICISVLYICESVRLSVMSMDYIAHQAPLSVGFPGKNTRVGCHSLLQGWPRDWTPVLTWWLTKFTSECSCIFAFIPSVFSVRHCKY